MIKVEMVGWASSLILLLTLIKQVHKQWTARTSEGISKWLFIGQLAASLGFTYYSYRTGSWVFLFTNVALTVNNIIGIALYFLYRRNKSDNYSGPNSKPFIKQDLRDPSGNG